ncbi:uncharacterized protein LOC111015735 [Momordica charantia]|uniref:Uncharacterized protein LOC111015735 n=1 Tax=Momordica charantia TaxID=3673 RepID=A0A6J1CZN9_MOMCH|nr:uncharacterized protein LOC111015735 [Momordica charantia]
MAKSMRSKREKRLRAIRREMVEPFYDNKDAAKLAAQQAALAAPKLPVRPSPFTSDASTTDVAPASTSTTSHAPMAMDVELDDPSQSMKMKPVGGIGKKSGRKFKVGKAKRRGKCRIKRNRHI